MPNKGNIHFGRESTVTQPNFRGLPHETVDEYLSRGGVITKIRSNCWNEYPYRLVRQTFSRQIKEHRGFFVETG